MHVSTEIKDQVDAKLRESIARAEAHYGQTFKFPNVKYTVGGGRVAGWAQYDTWTVNFNSALLMENVEDFLARTVPHEMAHLIDHQLHPENFQTSLQYTRTGRIRRSKRSIHGPTFKAIMVVLGGPTERCHDYENEHLKIKKTTTKHIYVCRTCGGEMTLGPKRHRKMQLGVKYFMRPCRYHAGYDYKGTNAPVRPLNQSPRPTPKRVAGTESKLDHCRRWFNPSLTRKENIGIFVNQCSCTPAGASTYYQTIKKEHG